MANKQDEKIRGLLKQIVDHFDQEDRAVRDRQLRMWKRLKLYWDGFQRVWYSEVAHDWRIQDDLQVDTDNHNDYYDKPVNVFRAYLESIIAALSVAVPPAKGIPDDADNPLDTATAKAADRIGELIYKHNDVPLLWIHALYIYCTEGLIACYNWTKEDTKFGTYTTDEHEVEIEEQYLCPECESQIGDDIIDSAPVGLELECPECAGMIDPALLEKSGVEVPHLVGVTEHPKSRQMLEVYGGLFVKIPNYATSQEECPYLIHSKEVHYAIALEMFPDLQELKNDWQSKVGYDAGGVYDPYERWARLNPQYQGEYPINTVTIRYCWFRPAAFNVLPAEDAKLLRKKFPTGVKFTLANEECAEEPIEECLDDHWTLTRNPLSDYLHHDPLGLLLTSIQDITNELVSLVLQTIEHGIPQTFADPNTLNFEQYRQTEVAPGAIFPARPTSGKGMGESFYEIKTATLSGEVLPFGQQIQNFGQLVSGALPSLFGGMATAGSKTASEYAQSRAQALQRLQTPWKMLTVWWKEIFGKVIPAYIENVVEDEHYTQRQKDGSFINIFIRKAELQGKLGDIELAVDEQLPATWTAMKDVIMQLMELNNPQILAAITSPENLPYIAQAIGLNQFVVPGEADRQKQYEEISILVNSAPIPVPDQSLQEMTEGPSVPIDPDVDNHAVQAAICQAWAKSEAGKQAKIDNKEGYKNVILHLKMHQMALQAEMAPPPEEGGLNTEKTEEEVV